MGNLKWNEILDVDSTSLKNDEDKAEEMFGFLAEVRTFQCCVCFLFHCLSHDIPYPEIHECIHNILKGI